MTPLCLFFFNDTATTEIYTLSLHDALPILPLRNPGGAADRACEGRIFGSRRPRHTADGVGHRRPRQGSGDPPSDPNRRSEEHTSELQSRQYLVCRLLLEKKKKKTDTHDTRI